jgi:hypothetical protein
VCVPSKPEDSYTLTFVRAAVVRASVALGRVTQRVTHGSTLGPDNTARTGQGGGISACARLRLRAEPQDPNQGSLGRHAAARLKSKLCITSCLGFHGGIPTCASLLYAPSRAPPLECHRELAPPLISGAYASAQLRAQRSPSRLPYRRPRRQAPPTGPYSSEWGRMWHNCGINQHVRA